MFYVTVFIEVFKAGAFDFGGGDFLEPSTLFDCGCLGGFTADPVAGLNEAPVKFTTRFILFVPGSNHSFVNGPLTRLAPLRAAWLSVRGDAMGSPNCPERGGRRDLT